MNIQINAQILNKSNLQLFTNVGDNINCFVLLTRYNIQVPTIQLKTLCHFLAQFDCFDIKANNICYSLFFNPRRKKFGIDEKLINFPE